MFPVSYLKQKDLLTSLAGSQVHACIHAGAAGRLTHMLITADCSRVGMRCWAIIRMLSHMLITTLQLRRKAANSRCDCFFPDSLAGTVRAAQTYILPAAHLNSFHRVLFCLHPTLAVAVISGGEDAGM